MLKILMDSVVKLAEVREKNKEKLFSNFLLPAFESFEKAHLNYLDTLQKYRDYISDSTCIDSPTLAKLQEMLRKDSDFYKHVRVNAIQEADVLRSSKRYDFQPFINAINGYFVGDIKGQSEFVYHMNGSTVNFNVVRERLLRIIMAIQEPEIKDLEITVNAVDELIANIQSKRMHIHREFLKAKKSLLPV